MFPRNRGIFANLVGMWQSTLKSRNEVAMALDEYSDYEEKSPSKKRNKNYLGRQFEDYQASDDDINLLNVSRARAHRIRSEVGQNEGYFKNSLGTGEEGFDHYEGKFKEERP